MLTELRGHLGVVMAVMRSEDPRAPSPGGGAPELLAAGAGAQSSSSSPSASSEPSLPPAQGRGEGRTASHTQGQAVVAVDK